MNKHKCIIALLAISVFLSGQGLPQGDLLSETPLYPVPTEMTFEEYQDMNRRLTIGLALTSIPIPGIVHRYAGEKKTARRLFLIGAGGLGLMIAGGSKDKEKDWAESPYEVMILNEGEDDEKRYQKVPVNQVGDDIGYKLVPLHRESNGSGGGLMVLGAVILVGDILYDWIHGWKTIVNKRDAVRYKYGQQLQFSVIPEINLSSRKAGINFNLYF